MMYTAMVNVLDTALRTVCDNDESVYILVIDRYHQFRVS